MTAGAIDGAGAVPPKIATPCVFCGSASGNVLTIREMMFGTRRPYHYFHCAACGACELRSTVSLAEHYPSNYDAYRVQPRPAGVRRWLRTLRNRGVFRGNPAGLLLDRIAPYPVFGAARWFRRMRARTDWAMLDVGCGSGELLRDLRESGFARAEGIDPFLPDVAIPAVTGLVRRGTLEDVSGPYDLIMLHHVLEHIPGQRATLRRVAGLLRTDGYCLVRIPILPNAAWELYREHWVQFDAPRHVVIHSVESITRLAEEAGFMVEHVEFDSTEFQFMGSELYARDVPLSALASSFSPPEIRRFRTEARRLNAQGRGDQAAIYLRRIG